MAYNIKRTNGDVIKVQPGQVNGPGNLTNNFVPTTDLDIFGQGALNWGAGVDQNLVHLLESWACGSVLVNTINGQPQYRPKTAAEIGVVGAGVNQPSIGQMWFNTTDNKLYVCYDLGNGDPIQAKWKTAGADPELFVPASGGTFSGNVEIAKSDPSLILTADDGSDMAIEMRDPNRKMLLMVNQQTFPVGSTSHPYIDGPLTEEKEVDTVLLRKAIGNTVISEMRLRDDYVQFVGGTFGVAGGNAGKVRTPSTNPGTPENNYNDGDHGQVLTTKNYVDTHAVSTHGATMDGNLRIEKDSPQIALERINSNVSSIFFDQDGVLQSRIVARDDSVRYLGLRKYNGAATLTNFIDIHDNYVRVGSQIEGQLFTGNEPDTALTPKKYVDDIAVNQANFLLNSGDTASGQYKFGPDNNDTRINNALIRTTLGGLGDTQRRDGAFVGATVQLDTQPPGSDPHQRFGSIELSGDDGITISSTYDNNPGNGTGVGTITMSTIGDGNGFDGDHPAPTILLQNTDDVLGGASSTITPGVVQLLGSRDHALFGGVSLDLGVVESPNADAQINFYQGSSTAASADPSGLRSRIVFDNNVPVGNVSNSRDQLRIQKWSAGGSATGSVRQEIVLGDDATAFRGQETSPGANILIQQSNSKSAGTFGITFQEFNVSGTNSANEYQDRGGVKFNDTTGGDDQVIVEKRDTELRSVLELGTDSVNLNKFGPSAGSLRITNNTLRARLDGIGELAIEQTATTLDRTGHGQLKIDNGGVDLIASNRGSLIIGSTSTTLRKNGDGAVEITSTDTAINRPNGSAVIVRDDEVTITKPVRLTSATALGSTKAQAARILKGPSAPNRTDSAEGDFWLDTNATAVYVAIGNQWLKIAGTGADPVTRPV